MAKITRHYFLIKRDALEDQPVAVVLDMMRYDSAIVHSNGPDGYYLLSTDSQRGPCIERWRSFAIKVFYAEDRRDWTDPYQAVDWARREVAGLAERVTK